VQSELINDITLTLIFKLCTLNLKRIAVTGPESTGKSWLAEKLANHYKTLWVAEIARDYLESLGRAYEFEDIAVIAREQLKLEDEMAGKAFRFLFCDTDMLVTKVWSRFKFDKCDPWIEEKVLAHRYGLYLLCNIDLPWQQDPLREHPHKRKELFEIYNRELDEMKVEYKIISGTGDERLRNAISALEEAFSSRR
jgi:NadR type nicotinamide-nucleotide adenylyltransferase